MDAIPYKRLLFTLAIYAGLATTALAQPPGGRGGPRGGGPPGGGGIGMLLRSDEVREELELLDDQVEQLRELEQEMREEIRSKMRERFQGMRGGERRGEGAPRGERGPRRDGERGRRGGPGGEDMRAMFEEMREQAETRVAEVLTTQQMDRLKQINLQQEMDRGGARALMGGPVAEALDLSDEQKQQLRERAQEVRAEMEKKMQAAREEARAQLMEILTSEQKAKLEEMTGTPFAMTRPERGPGPPPGFDRGGPGGRPGPPERGGRRRGGRGEGGRPGPPPRE